MKTRRILYLILIPALLACTITKPIAQISESISTRSPTPPATYAPDLSRERNPKACKVTADGLNVRDDSSISGDVIGWLQRGDVVTMLPDPPVKKWIRIQTGQIIGWIYSKYCKGIDQ